MVRSLPGVQGIIMAGFNKSGHDDPFCNWGPVDTGRGGEGDLCGRVDGVVGDVIGASGKKVDEVLRWLDGWKSSEMGLGAYLIWENLLVWVGARRSLLAE